jgi:hypothetical protein
MGGAVGVLMLAVALVIAVKGLPLATVALEGRRIEAAVREGDAPRLRRAIAGAEGLAELRRVLARLPTRDLLALGNGLVEPAEDERGAQILAAIADVVERRDQVVDRWARLRERRAPAVESAASRET